MNEKVSSILQKAQQERKRAQFDRALKRLEQGIAAHPDELELYLEAIDVALDGGEMLPATNLLKTVQEKFTRERERVLGFVREKLERVHDASLARCVIEHAVKRRDLESALTLLDTVPDHTVRDLVNRTKNKAQSLKSASRGGYTVGGESLTNEIVNAMLSVRLGGLRDAMTILVRVVEEKPAEYKAMDAFLATLATRHPKSGHVRHARGCAQRIGGNEIDALQHFIESARLEAECAPACAEQLRAMLEKPRHPGKIRHALAEILLITGKYDEAAMTLHEHLEDNPGNAREVIMLLRPFIDREAEPNACTWLAVEQALGTEQSGMGLEILRALRQRGNHAGEVYDWLETRASSGLLPIDVMLFHGSLALDLKHFDRAAEILSAVCSTSSGDVTPVLSLIDRHREAHPALDELYRKHAPVEEAPAESSADGGDDGDFQTFEPGEFRLEKSANTAPAPPPGRAAGPSSPAPEKPAPRFSTSPFASAKGNKADSQSFIDARELTFDDDDESPEPGEDGGEPMESSEPREIAETAEITEPHVTHVAQQLYLAGASAFFHIDETAASDADDSSPAQANLAPEPAAGPAVAESAPAASPAASPAAAPAAGTRPAPHEPFEARYRKFTQGELSNGAVLELLEEAARDGRMDELQALLHFEPETGEELSARYYYQAEYHRLSNRPLQALEILARLDTPDLAGEQKRRIWYKIAIAQRMTDNFAGAAETLDRLVQHFPGRDDLERLRRRNQEQFIEQQSMSVPTLEKTASLD
jgi:tetratricopeptide (TPR) repeat protein